MVAGIGGNLVWVAHRPPIFYDSEFPIWANPQYTGGSGPHGYGFHVGTQISTRTPTRENPTRVPAGYTIPAVQHYLGQFIFSSTYIDRRIYLIYYIIALNVDHHGNLVVN